MPVCRECGKMAATVEMRRCPPGKDPLQPPQYVCKSKLQCQVRKRERKEQG